MKEFIKYFLVFLCFVLISVWKLFIVPLRNKGDFTNLPLVDWFVILIYFLSVSCLVFLVIKYISSKNK